MNVNISQVLPGSLHRKAYILGITIALSFIVGYFLIKIPLTTAIIIPAFVIFLLSFRKPDILIWILVFGSVADFTGHFASFHISVGTINFFLIDVLVSLSFLLALFLGIVAKKTKFFFTTLDFPLIIFFILGCAALFRGVFLYGEHSFNQFRIVFYSVLYFTILVTIKNLEQIQKTVKVFFIACIPITLFGFYNLLTRKPTMLSTTMSERFLYGSQSEFIALSVIFSTCILLFKVVSRYRWVLITIIIAQNIGILLALFRATWLGLIAAFIFMGVLVTKESKMKLTLFVLCFLIISILGLSVATTFLNIPLVDSLIKNVKSIYYYEESPTAQWRLRAWSYGIEMISVYPIWGTGFKEFFNLFNPSGILDNSYLWLTIKMGLTGLGVFLWIILLFFKEGIKFFKSATDPLLKAYILGIMSSYLSFLVFAFFGGIFETIYLRIFIWIIPGLGMALLNVVNKNKSLTKAR
jgi:O-antigen ligase